MRNHQQLLAFLVFLLLLVLAPLPLLQMLPCHHLFAAAAIYLIRITRITLM
jgi:hypothetical protein